MILSQLIFNALITGSIYALIACGFSLIYSTNKYMHFAHGSVLAGAGYLMYTAFNLLKIAFVPAVLLSILFSCVLGVIMLKFIYTPMKKKKSSNAILLIASVGILILVENLLLLAFGAANKRISYTGFSKGLIILGANVTLLQIIIIASTLVLLLLLFLLMNRTSLGKKLRAVADNPELASIVGVNKERIAYYSFIIGSFLAGVAGILIAMEQSVQPTTGTVIMIKGFTATVIGGIGSVPGSIIGGFILGTIETAGGWFLPMAFKDLIAFALLFLFLLLKPQGLFNRGEGK